jgi:alkylhydroperoxidase family enzyme
MARVAIPEAFESNPTEALELYAPAQFRAGMGFGRAVYQETKLPYRLIEAARFRTAQINGCLACQAFRAARDLTRYFETFGGDYSRSFAARAEALPDESFYAAINDDWRNAPAGVLLASERLAIEFAERMGASPRSFEHDEPFWEKLHAAFTDAEIVDLTLAVASWIALGRMAHVLGTDPAVCSVIPAPEPA